MAKNGCSDTTVADAINGDADPATPAPLLPEGRPRVDLIRFSWLTWQTVGIIAGLLMLGAGGVASHTTHGNKIGSLETTTSEIKADAKESHIEMKADVKAIHSNVEELTRLHGEQAIEQSYIAEDVKETRAEIKEIKALLQARPD